MPNRTANPRPSREPTDTGRPLSSLCREIGLAAVAIELKLELSTLGTLEPDVAEAIEQGAAALFDAGYGLSLIGHQRTFGSVRKAAVKRCGGGRARQDNPSRSRRGKVRLSCATKPMALEPSTSPAC
jgi:hypothetical protein